MVISQTISSVAPVMPDIAGAKGETDGDNVQSGDQSGDQTTPDVADVSNETAGETDGDNVQFQNAVSKRRAYCSLPRGGQDTKPL